MDQKFAKNIWKSSTSPNSPNLLVLYAVAPLLFSLFGLIIANHLFCTVLVTHWIYYDIHSNKSVTYHQFTQSQNRGNYKWKHCLVNFFCHLSDKWKDSIQNRHSHSVSFSSDLCLQIIPCFMRSGMLKLCHYVTLPRDPPYLKTWHMWHIYHTKK